MTGAKNRDPRTHTAEAMYPRIAKIVYPPGQKKLTVSVLWYRSSWLLI